MSSLVLCQLEKHFVLHHPQPLPTGAQQSPGRRGQRKEAGATSSLPAPLFSARLSLTMGTGTRRSALLRHGQRGAKCGTRGIEEGIPSLRMLRGWEAAANPPKCCGVADEALNRTLNKTRWVLQAAAYTPHRTASTARAFREHNPPQPPSV